MGRSVMRKTQRAQGPLYWNFKDSRMRGGHPPLEHSTLPALRAQHRDEPLTPQVPQRAVLQGWGTEGQGILYGGRGEGTGAETCTLTPWLYPSPLGPGVAP